MGARAKLATTISAEMRAAIDQEAAESGRSKSQVVELWLEQARVLHTLRLMHPRGPGASFDPPRKKRAPEDHQAHFDGFL